MNIHCDDDAEDKELILKIRGGDEVSASVLVEKYTGQVESIARKYYVPGADAEDIIQEGFIGFYEAVKGYQCESNLPFRTFAFYCIKKNIYDIIQFHQRKKRVTPADIISLDAILPDEDRENKIRVIDQIVSKKYISPEETVIIKCLVAEIVLVLSQLERKILLLSLNGKPHETIAEEVGITKKAVGNALQRARQKIKQYLIQQVKVEGQV